MDNGNHVNEFKRLSDDEKRALTHIESLRALPVDSYLALGFTATAAGAAPSAAAGQSLLVLHLSPLKVEMFSPEGELQVSLNERALLHYEASAAPIGGDSASVAGAAGAASEEDRHGGKKVIDYGEDGAYRLLVLPVDCMVLCYAFDCAVLAQLSFFQPSS